MPANPNIADITVALDQNCDIIGFLDLNLPDGVTLGKSENATQYDQIIVNGSATKKYIGIRLLAPESNTTDTRCFKFLGAAVIDDSGNEDKRREWKAPVFGESEPKSLGRVYSRMTIFLQNDDVKDHHMHRFSILYTNCTQPGVVKVFDPGIQNQED